MAETATLRAGKPAKRRSRGIPERRLALFMVAPSIVLIALVALWPIIYAIWLSMHEYSLRQAGLSRWASPAGFGNRSEEHTSELQSHSDLVCRLLLEKKK